MFLGVQIYENTLIICTLHIQIYLIYICISSYIIYMIYICIQSIYEHTHRSINVYTIWYSDVFSKELHMTFRLDMSVAHPDSADYRASCKLSFCN